MAKIKHSRKENGQNFTTFFWRKKAKINLHQNFLIYSNYLAKFQSPTAVSWPKIIQLEQTSKLICNSWLYILIPKIKSISQSIGEKSGDNCFISELRKWVTLYVPAT